MNQIQQIKRTMWQFICSCLILTLSSFQVAQAQTSYFYTSENLLSSRITCISQDADGYLWVGTDCGLNRFDGYRFTEYVYQHHGKGSIKSNFITCMFSSSDGTFWVGTSKGLMRYDREHDQFVNIPTDDGENPHIASYIFTGKNQFSVGTAGHGLYRWNPQKQVLNSCNKIYPSKNQFWSRLYRDPQGNLWKSGLNDRISFFDHKTKKEKLVDTHCGLPTAFLPFGKGFLLVGMRELLVYQNGQLRSDAIDMSHLAEKPSNFRIAVRDKQGNVYVGSYGQGLFVIPRGTMQMHRVPNPTADFDLSTANIYALYIDKEDNIWVGCNRKGLLMIPSRKASFQTWRLSTQNYSMGASVSSVCPGDNGILWCVMQNVGIFGFDNIGRIVAHPNAPKNPSCIARDRQGNYWVGTDCGLYTYNPKTGASQLQATLDGEYVKNIVDGPDGKIYASTGGHGFISFDKRTKAVVNYQMTNDPENALCNNWINTMQFDHRGLLWIGTASGVSCFNPKTRHFRKHPKGSLAYSLVCVSLAELPNGDIALGGDNGLYLYHYASGSITPFPDAQALSGKMVMAILPLRNGDLWCSSSYGLWHYQKSKKSLTNYLHAPGLGTREYEPEIRLQRKDGSILFGINDGVTIFHPERLVQERWKGGTIHLCNIFVEGKPVQMGSLSNGNPIIKQKVTEASDVTVSYQDNAFSLEVTTFNYANASNTNYLYRINGGKQWYATGVGKNVISFNRLSAGDYKLEIKAIRNGVASPTKVMWIHVTPPWYHTTWAYLLYLLIVTALSWYVYKRYQYHKIQKMENDKTKVLFNATHDIRSPLTLIMSPLNKLQKRDDLDKDAKNQLNVIERNANRILNLVNQILDLRKLDCQQLHIHCQRTNLVTYIQECMKLFEYQAETRNIKLHLSCARKSLYAWIDRQNFDKVINNLVSNSFKFTGVNGNIEIILDEYKDSKTNQAFASIIVEDTGIGLDGLDVTKIFDRFYQSDKTADKNENGTGIGLNLCKMIVEMHHGNISAQNRTDRKGSLFKIILPLGNSHLLPSEIETESSSATATSSTSKPRVMVVDDDPEIGQYIESELRSYYNFTHCQNGEEAHRLLPTENFDLVISDVMMPEMDGFTLLRLIKSNNRTNHIPVIMLTSKSDVGNRLMGLEKGADAFLSKPFDVEELHLLIKNLLNNVRRLKGKFSGMQQPTEKIENVQMKGNDEVLMDRVMKAINKNLSDCDFGVEELAQEVGISRAQLHRKMKELTGIPTSEFLRNIRLEQAARILSQTDVNVTQIAYQVGFNNQSYFSTCFKRHFGLSPSEYAAKSQEGKE